MSNDFKDDDLNDLFVTGGPVAPRPVREVPAAYVKPEVAFTEGCTKCRGTGRFVSYSGRQLGECFACKGKGSKTFKSSSATRAHNRDLSTARKAAKVAADLAAFEAREPAVWAWLKVENAKAAPFEFAKNMVEAIVKYGDLTEKQLATCQRLVQASADRKAQWAAEKAAKDAAAPVADVSKLDAAFAVARERAQRTGQMGVFVKPLKLTADGVSVSIQPGKPGSKWDGYLFVRDSQNDDRKLGFFKDGKYIASRDASAVEQAAVLTCATDPHTAVIAYAKAWSRCGVCGHGLLNDVSIEAGMGPVCRAKFGWA
jgi:hypothetical protein